jgi:hypothetical protein
MPNIDDKAAADILADVGRVVGTSAISAHQGSALVQSQSFRGRTDRAFHPIGWVLQFHLTVEFCGQIPLDQSGAKPRTPGRQNGRPVPLAPAQAKLTTLSLGCQGPGDFDIPLIVRQRAIFRRIGPEFMQGPMQWFPVARQPDQQKFTCFGRGADSWSRKFASINVTSPLVM